MPMDCKAAGATAETGSALVCLSSPDEALSIASPGTGMLRRKVESTMVIRVFFILTSTVTDLRYRMNRTGLRTRVLVERRLDQCLFE
jgi:hypothetical protein